MSPRASAARSSPIQPPARRGETAGAHAPRPRRQPGVQLCGQLLQLRHGPEAFRRSPGFDCSAAHTAGEQPDRNPQRIGKLPGETIGDPRKPADRVGRADRPVALHLRFGEQAGSAGHAERANQGVRGCQPELGKALAVGQAPGHVGLSRAEPYLSNHHVPNRPLLPAGLHHQFDRLRRGRERIQPHGPAAVRAGNRLLHLPAEAHLDGCARRRPAPDRRRNVPLQHHAVPEDPGQFERPGVRRAKQQPAAQNRGQKTSDPATQPEFHARLPLEVDAPDDLPGNA